MATSSLWKGGVLALAAVSLSAQTIFDDWRIRFPNPPSNTLQTAIYAEGQFVAAGIHATVVTSATGTVWETQFLEPEFDAEGLVFAEGTYVMVDRNGQVAASDDLQAWRLQYIGASTLEDLIHAEGQFITVGRLGRAFVSEDGENWIRRDVADTTFHLMAVAYGNDAYVALARGGATFRSTNLIDWTMTFAGYKDTENPINDWEGMAYFNDKFIAYGPTDLILVSDTGTDWTEVPHSFNSFFKSHVEWKGELWLSGNNDAIIHSSDGLSWNHVAVGEDVSAEGIAASPDRIVAFDRRGGVLGSDDGMAWSTLVEGGEEDLSAVAEKDGRYVTVAGSDRLLYSDDGVNWMQSLDMSETTTNYNPGLGVVGGRFVVVSGRGEIAWSEDGISWNTDTFVDFTAIAREVSVANNILFAGCDSGIIAYTTDGINWTEVDTETGMGYTYRIEQVSFFNDTYFAAGGNGTLLQSTDLATWNPIPLGGPTAVMEILLYFNNKYILFPVSANRVLFSDDLVTWTEDRLVPVIRTGGAWIYDDQILVAGSRGSVYSSSDGVTFTEHVLPVASFREILYDGTQYFAVGDAGVVATTGNDPLSALFLTVQGEGTVRRSPDQALYDDQTIVRLTPSPGAGQQFLWWETAAGPVQQEAFDLVLTTDTNVTAVFAGLTPPDLFWDRDDAGSHFAWDLDPAWILHHASGLTDWHPTPGVIVEEDTGRYDDPESNTDGHFYQFRLRTP